MDSSKPPPTCPQCKGPIWPNDESVIGTRNWVDEEGVLRTDQAALFHAPCFDEWKAEHDD